MSQTAEELKDQLIRLPQDERAELAQFLIDSLDGQSDPDAEEAWARELVKRAEEIQTGQAVGEPSEQVFARLREKYG